MDIAYLLAEPLRDGTGVARKVSSQVAAWRERGCNVHLLAFASAAGGPRLIAEFDKLCRRARGLDVDVVYVRLGVVTPSLLMLQRAARVVLEVNSDDLQELVTRRAAFRAWHRATRRLAVAAAAGIVVPTYELASRPENRHGTTPTVVVSNGVDLQSVTPLPAPRNVRPRLAFTYASRGPWPGVDLVLEGASLLPEFEFDVVGPVPVGAPELGNVTYHGHLSGSAYDAVVARADVGIGSLGLFRIGLSEACTLKGRGYLAAGIPMIIGHRDTDFPRGADFLLEIPNRADGVRRSLVAIRQFVNGQQGRRVPREAIQHIDITEKERQRLDFLRDVAARTRCET